MSGDCTTAALVASWKEEEAAPFSGWDFSYLEGRMHEEQTPWSYSTRAAALMRSVDSLLDMGTGGGERLLSLCDAWPTRVSVTEAHPPNVALCRERLQPLGVEVVDVALRDHDPMPFDDAVFGLVLNRHSAFNVDEVARILQPGGTFLTQQVHGLWMQDLMALFGVRPKWPNATPQRYLPWLEAAGMIVEECEEWQGAIEFTDVGALVYYLKVVPWLVDGFSVESERDRLLALHERLANNERLLFESRKYLISARRPL